MADVPPDVTPPDLEQPWVVAPPVDGSLPVPDPTGTVGQGMTQPAPPPSHPGYLVNLGSVNNAGNQILLSVSSAIASYDDLKSTVAATKGWILWAPGPDTMVQDPIPNTGRGWPSGGLDPGGVTPGNSKAGPPQPATDPNPEATAQFGAVEDNLLTAIADVITAAGDYVRLVNTGAQLYTQADKASVLPPLTTS